VLDQITAKLRAIPDAELGDTTRELLHGRAGEISSDPGASDDSDPELDRNLIDLGLAALRQPPSTEGRP
jgi:metal-sulfur cluster biosynthetic enzyme